MLDPTYTDARDAASRRMTRGEADRVRYDADLAGRTTADEDIAYPRGELHEAWGQRWARDHPEGGEDA